MKQVILLAALLVASIANQAQTADQTSAIVAQYMLVKDALVASDPADAATQANLLLKSLGTAKLESLKKDTKAIADSKDLKKQREAFTSLSDKLYTAVKAAKPATTPSPEATADAGPPPGCGSREGVRYHVCMERECGRGEFSGHPACARWKLQARRE